MRVQRVEEEAPRQAVVGWFVWGAQRCGEPSHFVTLADPDVVDSHVFVCREHVEASRG